MKNKTIQTVSLSLLLMVLAWSVELHARTVTHAPESLDKLDAGWAWAVESSAKIKGQKGFYIGYSIQRMMGEHSYIRSGCDSHSSDEPTLNEIIYGKKSPLSRLPRGKTIAEMAEAALKRVRAHKGPEKKVLKEVAIMFYSDTKAKPPLGCKDIKINNLELPMDLEDGPILWLGKAEYDQSIALLENFYNRFKKTASTDFKEDILTAVGIHGDTPRAFPFLKTVLTGNEPEEVREQAAFWIGEQQSPEAAKLLLDTASNDRSEEVREKAVFSLYRIRRKEADDALIHLAKHEKNRSVRKKAIFWLGQKAVKRSAEILTDVVNDEKDRSIQKAAIFALSQLSNNKGLDALIKIARTHKSLEVRKKAIFWLSQSEDPRALDTIIEILER
jgi:hypothetical protein